jgi:L-ascorbate metabolism protein UlaG (beta-lactamase superfamily)
VEILNFFASPLKEKELTVFYLEASGFIARTASQTVIVDPAGLLKNDEIKALKKVNLMLFTHNHSDHFSSDKTLTIFKATSAAILADPKVAKKLERTIPLDKLVSAEPGKTYNFDDVTATAIQGIHRGPIMLYKIKMGGITLFHGGDSGYVNLKDYPSQVAIVPVGGMYPTASPENAYKMVSDVKPDAAITMHGSDKQKQQFEQKVKESMPKTTVINMQPYTAKTISVPNR